MKQFFIFHFSLFILQFAFASASFAVPETVGVRISDVSTSSFCVVWMTDVAAEPAVEVYSDQAMTNPIADRVIVAAMPAADPAAAEAARAKGIMKARVSGLSASTRYYVRTVTRDPANSASVAYSQLLEVMTASRVAPYHVSNGTLRDLSNDILGAPVYIIPGSAGEKPGLGDLIILETAGAPYPVSAFAGDGTRLPSGVLDLNNLFGEGGVSLAAFGGEKIVMRIYRGGALSTLVHYRRLPASHGMAEVADSVKGFFADINLDGKVDEEDFLEFKKQYRTLPDSVFYNPDFNFVDDAEGVVDIREFSRFSREFGKANVE